METTKIYLIGGRVVEISPAEFETLDLGCLWVPAVDTDGNVHHILRKNIVDIVCPAEKSK